MSSKILDGFLVQGLNITANLDAFRLLAQDWIVCNQTPRLAQGCKPQR